MSENDQEATGPLELGRRSLLKKAGAAGAMGLAAPIVFDSLFSPAAACSGFANITVANLTPTPTSPWRSNASNQLLQTTTVSVPAVPGGSNPNRQLLIVANYLQQPAPGTETVVVTADPTGAPAAIAGTSLVGPDHPSNPYRVAATDYFYYLIAYRVPITITTATTYLITVDPFDDEMENFIGQVALVTSNVLATPPTVGAAVFPGTNPNTSTVRVVGAGAANDSMFVAFGAAANFGDATAVWTLAGAAAANFTPALANANSDDNVSGSPTDVALMTAWSNDGGNQTIDATGGPASSGTPPSPTRVALAVPLSC